MKKICGYCGKYYFEDENKQDSCRYHPQFFFPYDIDKDGIHDKGWQCCGSEDSSAPGCVISKHRDDVKKVYRRNSIAFDYVIINEDEEQKKKELNIQRTQIIKNLSLDPINGPLVNKIKSFINQKVSKLKELVGEPYESITITNGVSGIVNHSKALCFNYKNLYFMVYTDYEPDTFSSWFKGEIYDYTIRSINWFADHNHINEYRKNMITDLTSD